nr:hypothetical protein [Saccharopolyspora sp. HNM0986]
MADGTALLIELRCQDDLVAKVAARPLAFMLRVIARWLRSRNC